MKNLSLKLEDNVFSETENVINQLHKSRNRYINEALDFYNKLQNRRLLARQLQTESKMVAEDSIEMLREFEEIDFEDEAI